MISIRTLAGSSLVTLLGAAATALMPSSTLAAAGQHATPLAFTITPPAVPDDAQAAALGITELVSEQSTSFAGSTAERITNIQAAAAKFQGVMVAPGATFSFGDNLGDVSLETGFAEALIIYGGRTIRGVGDEEAAVEAIEDLVGDAQQFCRGGGTAEIQRLLQRAFCVAGQTRVVGQLHVLE